MPFNRRGLRASHQSFQNLNLRRTPSFVGLPASQREGVSHSFLLAILKAWRVPVDMTTYQLCDQFVKPACRKADSGFLGVIMKTKCPGDWFGPMDMFVSHWYVCVPCRGIMLLNFT